MKGTAMIDNCVTRQPGCCNPSWHYHQVAIIGKVRANFSLVSRLPRSGTQPLKLCKCREPGIFFSREHDINWNKTGVLRTERQHFVHWSTSYVLDVRCVWYSTPNSLIHVVSCLLPLLFFMIWDFRYAHTQIRSLYPPPPPLSTFAHMRKNTRLT